MGIVGSRAAQGGAQGGGRPNNPRSRPQNQKLRAVPTLAELSLLKYTDEDGKTQKVNIISRASPKWKSVAERLSKHEEIIAQTAQKYREDSVECLRYVLCECFIRNEPTDYSRDWNGIIEMLEDIEEAVLAAEVKVAVLRK